MKVAMLMGSPNDRDKMQPAVDTLEAFGLEADVRVLSAHRNPAQVTALATSARADGYVAFICGAGMAAHLAGVVAAHTTLPVVGVPLSGGAINGVDALYSTVQMPKGIPVATVAIDGSMNAALLVVRDARHQRRVAGGRPGRRPREAGLGLSRARRSPTGQNGTALFFLRPNSPPWCCGEGGVGAVGRPVSGPSSSKRREVGVGVGVGPVDREAPVDLRRRGRRARLGLGLLGDAGLRLLAAPQLLLRAASGRAPRSSGRPRPRARTGCRTAAASRRRSRRGTRRRRCSRTAGTGRRPPRTGARAALVEEAAAVGGVVVGHGEGEARAADADDLSLVVGVSGPVLYPCSGPDRARGRRRRAVRSPCPGGSMPRSSVPNVLAARYASADMAELWSPEHKVVLERQLWLAVLRGPARARHRRARRGHRGLPAGHRPGRPRLDRGPRACHPPRREGPHRGVLRPGRPRARSTRG